VASVIEKSTIFGAQLSATFVGSEDLNVKILTAVLIVLMSLSTFTTQRQLMRKNMPDAALDNPYMKQQKVILYLMPIFFAISGINFPIGVLLYWLTTNVWSMGQQFYVIRRMPAPGSAAERAYEERQRKRGKTIKKLHIPGLGDTTTDQLDVQDALPEPPKSGQRQQPKGKKRSKRSSGGGPTDGAGSGAATGAAGGGDSPDGSTPQDAPSAPSTPSAPSAPSASANGSEAGARPSGQRQQPKRQKQKPRPKQPQNQQVKRQTTPPGKRSESGTPSPDPV
jgi:YidC/Oxa1 family membrane protein insertase